MATTYQRSKEVGFKAHLETTCRALLKEGVLGATDIATAQISIRKGRVSCQVEVWHRGRKPAGDTAVTFAQWRLVEQLLGSSHVLNEFRPSHHRKNPVLRVTKSSNETYSLLFKDMNHRLACAGLAFRFRSKRSRNKTEPVVYSLVACAKRSRS